MMRGIQSATNNGAGTWLYRFNRTIDTVEGKVCSSLLMLVLVSMFFIYRSFTCMTKFVDVHFNVCMCIDHLYLSS
jgi:hypothetical protein